MYYGSKSFTREEKTYFYKDYEIYKTFNLCLKVIRDNDNKRVPIEPREKITRLCILNYC